MEQPGAYIKYKRPDKKYLMDKKIPLSSLLLKIFSLIQHDIKDGQAILEIQW